MHVELASRNLDDLESDNRQEASGKIHSLDFDYFTEFHSDRGLFHVINHTQQCQENCDLL